MSGKNKSPPELYQNKPWAENNNNIWLASTINIHRNIEKFLFPSKLSKEKRLQIIALVSKPLLNAPYLDHPVLIKSENIGPTEKEYLVEHFLSNQSLHQTHSGEAFILDRSGTFLSTLNVDNHIQFELIDCKGEIESAWNQMIKIETELGKAIQYSFSPKFGFLTSDPNICGTGFILKAYLQPSALIHTGSFKETFEKIKVDEISLTGIQGDLKEIIGDVYTVMNNYTLGLTEENILSTTRLFITKLLAEENTARANLRNHPNPEIMDKVSRAMGTLVHSYKIETIEALNAISLLKLGADLEWIEGVTPQELNRLFFDCRRAHLISKFDEECKPEDVPHKRAEYIHQTLKDVKLKI